MTQLYQTVRNPYVMLFGACFEREADSPKFTENRGQVFGVPERACKARASPSVTSSK